MFVGRQLLATLIFICGMGNVSLYAGMVVINEIMFQPRAKQPEYFVLSNLTATPLDIANWRVTEGVHFQFPEFSSNKPDFTLLKRNQRIVLSSHDEAQTRATYRIPQEVRVFGPWTGKLGNEGERVTVRDKNGALVCSLKYGIGGHWPAAADVAGRAIRLMHPNARTDDGSNWTIGAPRTVVGRSSSVTNVIINEIMYNPPSGWLGSEYVELYNRGEEVADVSGWRFADGIEFEFAEGTKIPPHGFLVIADNVARMRQIYAEVPVVGDFQGRLSGEGELLRLEDRHGNLINEVAYRAGGDWPELPDGGGSSLELIHPQMANGQASAWAASNEADQSARQHYSFTSLYQEIDPVGEISDYRELHLYLAGKGHAVLENIRFMADGTNCLDGTIAISTNGSGAGGWLCQGTHGGSFTTNRQLHLVADGRGDNRVNHAELDVPALRPGQQCELEFDARWISGNPRLIVETWDGSLSHSLLLNLPRKLGTPGRRNSQAMSEPPPQIDALRHHPAVPRSSDKLRVTAEVRSEVGLREVKLLYRADSFAGDEPWRSSIMADDGLNCGDAVCGDGIFTAELSVGWTNGAVVQFFVRAITTNGLASEVPRTASENPALFVVDDRDLPRDLRVVRLVLSARDLDALKDGNSAHHGFRFPRLSNHYFNATAIQGEDEVIYGAKVRQSGSVITRDAALRKFKLELPADHSFRGRTKFVFDDDAADGKAYHNRVTRHLLYLLGAPTSENEFVRLVVNAGPPLLREEVEPVDKEFLDRNFKDGHRGELYRIDDDWRVLDSGQGLHRDADWTYRGTDHSAAYRRSWLKRTGKSKDDFSHLIALFRTLSETNPSAARIDSLLDAPATLKLAAVRGYIGDWDNFTMQRGKNGYFFRPDDAAGRFQLLHWDSDEGFVTGQPFYGERIKRWVELPEHERLFRNYLLELVRLCSLEPARVAAWLAAEREAVGPSVVQAAYLNFFKAREAEVWQAIGGRPNPAAYAGTNAASLTNGNVPSLRLSRQVREE